MNNSGYQRWQEIYIQRALMRLPRSYIEAAIRAYKKSISPQMKRLIQWRLYQPEP
jgi:hypothetical protein